MQIAMQFSPAGQAMLKSFEGFRAAAYRDNARGRWTVGYGTTGAFVVEGLTVTQARAEELLLSRTAPIVAWLNTSVGPQLSQGQVDALVSFAYNEGLPALIGSTMMHLIQHGHPDLASSEFGKWVISHDGEGEPFVNKGLIPRRAGEAQMYRTGVYPPQAAPGAGRASSVRGKGSA